ncbi:MAG: transposase [Terriglobales bacterium]
MGLHRRNRKITIAKSVQTIKAFSSKWLNEIKAIKIGRFAWQEGYSAFSVSQSNMQAVAQYARNQAEHHGKHPFEDELRSLLIRHGVFFEEEHLFG